MQWWFFDAWGMQSVGIAMILDNEKVEALRIEAMDRQQRNLAVLKDHLPTYYEGFKGYTPERYTPFISDHGYVTIAHQDRDIYKRDPRLQADLDVDRFIKGIGRRKLGFELTVRECDLIWPSYRMLHEYRESATQRNGQDYHNAFTLYEGDLIVIIGVFCGYHIEKLINHYSCRHVVIIEPSPDLFNTSLFAMEWGNVFSLCEAKDINIRCYVGLGKLHAIEAAVHYLNQYVPHIYKHGMLVFSHADQGEYKEIYHSFAEAMAKSAQKGFGFFEDELYHLEKGLDNIKANYPAQVYPVNFEEEQPVLVIGAGPSLDTHIEFLKSNQKKLCIVSCGSSLITLIKHGIKPDLHVELESCEALITHYQRFVAHLDLSGIPAVIGADVPSEIIEMFDEVTLFYREPGPPSMLLPKSQRAFRFWGPTVTNAALSVLITVGFKNLYLFGVDYGFPSKDQHHVSGSHAYVDGVFERTNKNFISVDNVFGQPIETTSILFSAKKTAEELISVFRGKGYEFNVTNCSLGADIKGSEFHHFYEVNDYFCQDVDKSKPWELISSNSHTAYINSKDLSDRISLLRSNFQVMLSYMKSLAEAEIESLDDARSYVTKFSSYQFNRQIAKDPIGWQMFYGTLFNAQNVGYLAFSQCSTEESVISEALNFKDMMKSLLEYVDSKFIESIN